MKKRIAIITGATSGIGKATAMLLAKNNFNLILTGRRNSLLQKVVDEIKSNGADAIGLCFDIQKYNEVTEAFNELSDSWKSIDVLINNAGLAYGFDALQEGNIDDWEKMINTNIKGLLYVTKLVIPQMIVKNQGHIINIGSIAGKEVYPNGNVYCATKSAVAALTQGMRIDLLQYNIKVTSICPGMVETEFSEVRFKGDKQKAKKVYEGITPLTADDIADAIVWVLTRPAHVTINDILIMPTAQATATQVYRKTNHE